MAGEIFPGLAVYLSCDCPSNYRVKAEVTAFFLIILAVLQIIVGWRTEKIAVLWDVTPRKLVEVNGCSREICCFLHYHPDDRVSKFL